MPDPVVSPADTIRRAIWHSETCRYKPGCDCGYCAAQDALAALLAVGERDKAEIEAGQLNADVVADVHGLRDRLADWVIGDGTMISLRDVLDELCRILDPTVPPAGERDRQQIARLTGRCDGLEDVARAAITWAPGNAKIELAARLGAVLAGEEDAAT